MTLPRSAFLPAVCASLALSFAFAAVPASADGWPPDSVLLGWGPYILAPDTVAIEFSDVQTPLPLEQFSVGLELGRFVLHDDGNYWFEGDPVAAIDPLSDGARDRNLEFFDRDGDGLLTDGDRFVLSDSGIPICVPVCTHTTFAYYWFTLSHETLPSHILSWPTDDEPSDPTAGAHPLHAAKAKVLAPSGGERFLLPRHWRPAGLPASPLVRA